MVNWSLSCSWSVAECKKYRVIARRPLWADVAIPRYNEKIRCAGMSKVCPKMYLFCGISVYKHFTGRLPRRFAPRNDMVVVTRLRRFQQSDKLKFAPVSRTGRRRAITMIAAPGALCPPAPPADKLKFASMPTLDHLNLRRQCPGAVNSGAHFIGTQ